MSEESRRRLWSLLFVVEVGKAEVVVEEEEEEEEEEDGAPQLYIESSRAGNL